MCACGVVCGCVVLVCACGVVCGCVLLCVVVCCTRRRPDRTHGGVLNVHTGGFSSPLLFSSLVLSLFLHVSFSFFSSLFSFLFSPLSSLSSSLSAHTETRSDRQVTPPTMNGHAPRDPLNQERAINLSILAMSHPVKFSRVESNEATSSTPGGAHPSMPDFHVLRCLFRPLLSQDTVYRKINYRKLFGRMSNSTHAAFLWR